MEPTQNNKIKEVIDRLEVESWQLELLVSGFAIFLVAASFEPITEYGRRLAVVYAGMSTEFDLFMIVPFGLIASVFFLFVNLLLHLVFRGLWISAIGIRSLSGDIDLDSLNLVKPFDRFFANRLNSFDNYIGNLERISSVIFGFTFLLVFMVMSIVLLLLFAQLVMNIVVWTGVDVTNLAIENTLGVLTFFFFLCAFLYFIDFLTIGYFKRKRWIAVWYFPIYRLFSWLTLSFIYRPLYYNLIDNRFGKRVVLGLVPYMFIMITLVTIRASTFQFIPRDESVHHIISNFYDDEREKTRGVQSISIPSRYINNSFLELFLLNEPQNDNFVIKKNFPGIKPPQEEGFEGIFYGRKIKDTERTPNDSLLLALSSIYEVRIDDSLYSGLDYFFFSTQKYKQKGLKTIVDIQHLSRGKHNVSIDRIEYNLNEPDNLRFKNFATFPFWKE